MTKLSDADVIDAAMRVSRGESRVKVARSYGVNGKTLGARLRRLNPINQIMDKFIRGRL